MTVAVHWFRNGLRLHDNPALIEAINSTQKLITVYILDEKTFNKNSIGYHPMRFLLESLKDLKEHLTLYGGYLYILQGNPIDIFSRIKEKFGLDLITFEQDCDHAGKVRDDLVFQFCNENNIKCVHKVSHTLWNPREIIKLNGGIPPLTFKEFQTITNKIGHPLKPAPKIDWFCVEFGELPIRILEEFKEIKNPTTESFGMAPEISEMPTTMSFRWQGGETRALEQLNERLDFEKESFVSGFYIPNQINPDLLGPPSSLSAALRYGCLSSRTLFWELSKLFVTKYGGELLPQYSATSQLIWREYFYTMSINNEKFDQMEDNPACIPIPWSIMESDNTKTMLDCWKMGKTGFPFIDAGMRQLMQEGWIHHVIRNAVACFLTRGVLWINWTEGLKHFLKYLIDADYSVCSGNWIWVSSSTFEQLLDCPMCVCPVTYGYRLDPTGEYIKRYIPELRNMPFKYLYEPWKCPEMIQKEVGCIIGKDYPNRIVDHTTASRENRKKMVALRSTMMNESKISHCRPSDRAEVQKFMYLPDECMEQLYSNTDEGFNFL